MALAFALGLRRRRKQQTLDVWYPQIQVDTTFESHRLFQIIFELFQGTPEGLTGKCFWIEELVIQKILDRLAPDFKDYATEVALLEAYLQFEPQSSDYFQTDVVFYGRDIYTLEPLVEPEDAYFRLQLLSQRLVFPHQISLKNIFSTLPTLAWTNQGPMLPEEVGMRRLPTFLTSSPLQVSHLDKFPYLLEYHLPSGVRIADGACVRLGAYLGEGCTVMPAGYVNFNAGAVGPAMIEGRISQGVLVGKGSDIGGGASTMGTLSGGNNLPIVIGSACLLGANAGTGISLGKGCTIAAGLYIYAGMKIALQDDDGRGVDLEGTPVALGKNIVKALELSGRDYMLFIQDSQSGQVLCKPNRKLIQLNEELHH